MPERDLRGDALTGHLADDPSLSRVDARSTKRAAPAALFTSTGRAERRPTALGEQPQPGLVARASARDDDERARTGAAHGNARQEGSRRSGSDQASGANARGAEGHTNGLARSESLSIQHRTDDPQCGRGPDGAGGLSSVHARCSDRSQKQQQQQRSSLHGRSVPESARGDRPRARLTPGRAERATGGREVPIPFLLYSPQPPRQILRLQTRRRLNSCEFS